MEKTTMKSRKNINAYLFIPILLLSLSFASNLANAAAQDNSSGQTANYSDVVVMHLGGITVRGQKDIIETLQAIKVALRQPISSDPKLANVMVCRLRNKAGSHLKQLLVCGTNQNLARNRDDLQTAMTEAESASDGGTATCESSGCYDEVFNILNQDLVNRPGQTLHAEVNGPGLRNLLNKIPYPAAAKAKTGAPAAGTRQP
ncbi:MAG: hypothetical protein KGK44_01625 [Gammaproteobacteria bacterium]|nr:hypothetical protein [Gammaproteobacteria bacterium]